MHLELEGRVVLVTGASRGIGAAVVERFLGEGARVAMCARNQDSLDGALRRFQGSTHSPYAIVADVATEDGVEQCVNRTVSHFGGLDVLISNAGGAVGRGTFNELTDVDWTETYAANVLSLVRLVRHSRVYLAQSDQARIVVVSSATATEPGFHDPHYSSAKAALNNVAKHLASVLSSDGISINVVSPGPVRSDGWTTHVSQLAVSRSSGSAIPAFEESMAARIPLGRIGETDEVADLIAFLASRRSSWVTGANVRIDGGKNRGVG